MLLDRIEQALSLLPGWLIFVLGTLLGLGITYFVERVFGLISKLAAIV